MGRGAAVNGNGRAVLPPGVIPQVTVYRQPLPERRGAWTVVGRMFLWLLVVCLMLAGGFAGGSYLWVERDIAEKLSATSPDVKAAAEKLNVVVPGEPTIALVLGYDKRPGREAATTGHSDTLMLVRADPGQRTISLLSFPRDLVVDIRCPGRSFRGRINTAYSECGAQGALLTVRDLTDVPINYLVTVNFRGFKQIVANLGGVWMDIDRRYFNNRSGPFGFAKIDLQPGYQKLNGQKALDFVRYRHTDSDLYRLARQQLFVKAMRQRMATFPFTDLPKLVGTITDHVEVGKAGSSEWNARTVLGYALLAYKLPAGHVFQAKLDPARLFGYAELSTDEENIRQAVTSFLNPDVEAADKATASALGRKFKRPAVGPPPSSVSVSVLNGNGVQGSASRAAYALQQRGYRIVLPPNGAPANAPSWSYFRTKIYFNPAKADAKLAAQAAGKLFGDADVGRMTPEIAPLANGATLVTVVGQTFHGSLGPAPVDQTPKRQPPAVEQNAAMTLPLLQKAQRRVRFPLEVPRLVERTSYLERDVPIRVYDVEGHRAVRLTFSTGANEYWGIQQVDWEDAPALAGPNTELRIKGREYHLYYAGPHLHMVVLYENGATYWVVNTLLDSLSNETMIAIARGLSPLGRA